MGQNRFRFVLLLFTEAQCRARFLSLSFPNIFSKARDIAALFSRIRLKSIVLSIVFDSSSRLHIRDRPRRSSKKNDVRFRGDEESSLEKKKIKERSRD